MDEATVEFLTALRPVVEHLGGRLIPADPARDATDSDDPTSAVRTSAVELTSPAEVVWQGRVVAFVEGPELHDALDRMVESIERSTGSSMVAMDRAAKQAAVRELDERGAFLLRGAVEDVAKMMGVSRVTLYSYLNAIAKGGPR